MESLVGETADSSADGRTSAGTYVDGDEQWSDLDLANLRTDVALSVTGLIDDVVEDAEARGVVVADIVECWARLPCAVRRRYEGRHGVPGVVEFGGDYVDEVDRQWRTAIDAKPFTLHDTVIEELGRIGWSMQVAQVRRRTLLGQPPSDEWLARFAPND